MYAGTDVSIYVDGRHHLGATLGSCSLVEDLSLVRRDAGLVSCPPYQTLLSHPHAAHVSLLGSLSFSNCV